ncbi:aminotransferase class IV family protein [Mesorhizobium sp. CA8]|uniref:aminotransferase class IV family protein n=1 Tax=unclassified Mesorhizobium TaxID=325217 RepID=UPI001CCEBEF3|nr:MULTISPECIES: aminotransferase class IV family protein [unclassified Mesorhizobium]MBZ9762290.1 aminotransferase class IV family protein [Mesorhizobium sp. CA8]MBZ9818665.1 aminotransferase class IV family protein [Mesorhizobium sp. CA4]
MSVESALRDGNGAGFELIETMRWEPGSGFLRFERHLARLYASAAELGFACDPARIGEVLSSAVGGHGVALRVRLALQRNGEAAAAAQAYEPLPTDKVWRLQLARIRLDSANTLLRHKTSLRQVYTQARSEYLATRADEVLLANERGELCEGTITNLFADFGDGPLATPRLDCGLLPGILRGELLDEGRAVEAIYSFDDLKAAKAIFVGNSLRGLIPARLG